MAVIENIAAGVCAITVISIILGAGSLATASGSQDEGRMPSPGGAAAWLNSAPLNGKSLRGNVVLINFWTYSCINSLRELPYVKAWTANYKDAGLVVIDVHAPEFNLEKDPANVKDVVADLGVTFPFPVDSRHSIWSAFHNEYWPADYFIDAKGRIRYRHFGEGDYAGSERIIQQLLSENGATDLESAPVRVVSTGAQASPGEDVWAGYEHATNFASRERVKQDSTGTYTAPARPKLNQWGLDGQWKVGPEGATLQNKGGRVVFRFHARDLHMVLSPAKNGRPIRFKGILDGASPENHGSDSSPDGMGEVRGPRLYQLIRQKAQITDRTFEIEFPDGVEIYSFTFG